MSGWRDIEPGMTVERRATYDRNRSQGKTGKVASLWGRYAYVLWDNHRLLRIEAWRLRRVEPAVAEEGAKA